MVTRRTSRRLASKNPLQIDNNSINVQRKPSTKRKAQDIEQAEEETDDLIPVKKRVLASPKKGIKKTEDNPKTPTKQRVVDIQVATPPSTPRTAYSIAKSLFQRSCQDSVIGREEERRFLKQYLKNDNGALYISGLPGTGKSALVNEVVKSWNRKSKSVINCMSVPKADEIYNYIYSSLTGMEDELNAQKKLEKMFFSTKNQYIVVLDELDNILTKDQAVLFKLFEWATNEESNLILIGIANALDLTERFLPRLKAQGCSPELYPFKPYTAKEISEIIESKLKSLIITEEEKNSEIPLMHPAAIQLCARKTAANTGDVRKSFDICRRAIELVEEQERLKSEPQSGKNIYSADLFASLSITNAPRATVMHVSKVCTNAFGGSTVARIKGLNLYQKALLCVVCCHSSDNKSNNKSMLLTELLEKFNQLSATRDRDTLGSLQFGEFMQLLTALESNSVVSIVEDRKTHRGQKRISSSVQKMDLMTGVSDVEVLKKFIKN